MSPTGLKHVLLDLIQVPVGTNFGKVGGRFLHGEVTAVKSPDLAQVNLNGRSYE